MKSSTFFFAFATATVLFTSCNKDKEVVTTPTPTPKNNLIAAIKFNGNSSDSAGNVNLNGTYGIPTLVDDRAGNPQRALYLDGNSYLEYFDAPIKGDAISMAAWVKFTQTGAGSKHFVIAMHPVKGGITLIQADDRPAGSISVPGTTSAFGDPVDKNWHHWVLTYDGTTIKIYVDGILISTKAHQGTIGNENRNLVIGSFGGTFWKGIMDDLRIYNTALTPAEVKEVFALQP